MYRFLLQQSVISQLNSFIIIIIIIVVVIIVIVLEAQTCPELFVVDLFMACVLKICCNVIQGVPLATEPGISLIILPLMRILQRNCWRTAAPCHNN